MSVLPVLTDSTSMENNVSPFLTNVPNGTSQDNVPYAMMDTTLFLEFVKFLRETTNLQMRDVEHGTGKTNNVWLVQITGFSTISENVFLYLTNVKHSTELEIVYPM